MKKLKKILILIISLLIFLIVAGTGYVYSQIKPVSNQVESDFTKVEISSGMSVGKISNLLKQKNLVKNDKIFYYSARYPFILKVFYPKEEVFNSYVLKSGTYYVSKNMNPVQILNLLSSGQTEYTKVSIPEGLTISKIGTILEENRVCSKSDFKESAHKTEIIEKYGIPADSCEGFLFPDTYYFDIGMKSDVVVQIMVDNFFEKIKSIPNLSEKTMADLYQTVDLASIVEREYRVADEAPLIASVFKNRLKYNIGLYSCATVVYILTEIEGRPHPDRVLLDDLKIDSPYNTYKHAGLPPTPISNPGLVALDAATNTPKTNYYFFQVTDAAAGRHVFSETFEEHKANHNLSVKK